MNNFAKTTKQNCTECKKEYEALSFRILGMVNDKVLGGGFCKECASKKRAELELKEQQVKKLEIINKRESWRKTCGIPLIFMNHRFETFKSKRTPSLLNAYNDCLDFANKFPLKGCQGYRSLVIYSEKDCGVGKSHLVAGISHKILDKWNGETTRCPIKYITESDLFLRIRNTFNRPNGDSQFRESEFDVYNELSSIPLLIIDDMGKEEVNDPRFVQRVLFEIINRRYNNTLPTIITANLNTDALERHLGSDNGVCPTFDRLIEMTGNSIREIIATTYRDLRNRK
jgi:DNA replication protein DnaC